MVRSDGNEVDRWRGGKMGSDESKMETMITDDNEVQSAISEKIQSKTARKNQQVIKYRNMPKFLTCVKLL